MEALVDAAGPPPAKLPRVSVPPQPRSWSFRVPEIGWRHLVSRFFASIRPGRPSDANLAWARALLGPGEWRLFASQRACDQRHAIGVAKTAYALAPRQLVARAGLMHDIGKLDCRLGAVGRSFATVTRRFLPVTYDLWCRQWWLHARRQEDGRLRPSRIKERFASYWLHPWEGRRMLEAVGADSYVALWAEHHHHWGITEDLEATWREACCLWFSDGD